MLKRQQASSLTVTSRKKETESGLPILLKVLPCSLLLRSIPVFCQDLFTHQCRLAYFLWPIRQNGYKRSVTPFQVYRLKQTHVSVLVNCSLYSLHHTAKILNPHFRSSIGQCAPDKSTIQPPVCNTYTCQRTPIKLVLRHIGSAITTPVPNRQIGSLNVLYLTHLDPTWFFVRFSLFMNFLSKAYLAKTNFKILNHNLQTRSKT